MPSTNLYCLQSDKKCDAILVFAIVIILCKIDFYSPYEISVPTYLPTYLPVYQSIYLLIHPFI